MAPTTGELVEYFRAIAETYADAAKDLRVTELKTFLVHEATWLNNVQVTGEPSRLLQSHTKEAAEYLAGVRALRDKRSPSLHILGAVIPLWLIEQLHVIGDWIGRLT